MKEGGIVVKRTWPDLSDKVTVQQECSGMLKVI